MPDTPLGETKCETRKALEDVLVLFESWRNGIFKRIGVAWESDPPAVVAGRKALADPCCCEWLREEAGRLTERAQEAMAYGRKNFDAALGFQDRALRAEAERDQLRAALVRKINDYSSLLAECEGLREEDGDGELCYYCQKPCSAAAARPTKWPIPLCHADEPGVPKWHHIGCVSERLAERDQLEIDVAMWKTAHDFMNMKAAKSTVECDQLRAELAEALEALKPFARYIIDPELAGAEFLRAAAVLEKHPEAKT